VPTTPPTIEPAAQSAYGCSLASIRRIHVP
jgi:hypothetical protein